MFPCQSVITNNKNYLHDLYVNSETRTPALSRCHKILINSIKIETLSRTKLGFTKYRIFRRFLF